jgi:hypothetical protein
MAHVVPSLKDHSLKKTKYYYYIANHYTNMCKVNPKVEEGILTRRTCDRAEGQVSPLPFENIPHPMRYLS